MMRRKGEEGKLSCLSREFIFINLPLLKVNPNLCDISICQCRKGVNDLEFNEDLKQVKMKMKMYVCIGFRFGFDRGALGCDLSKDVSGAINKCPCL